MLEQISNAITFYAFYVESKLGKTGLTVTVDVYENGTEIVTAASATEVGDGLYKYQLASGSVDAEGEYIAVFKTATDTVDQQHIPALWVIQKAGIENLDAAISSRSSHAAADIWAVGTRTLTGFGTLIADIWHQLLTGITTADTIGKLLKDNVDAAVSTRAVPGDEMDLLAAFDAAKTAAQAGDAMALTSGERTTLTAVIWAALTSGLTTVGSIGKLIVDNLNATVSSRSSHSAADVWSSATRTLSSFGTLVADVWAYVTRTLTSGAAPSAADIWGYGSRTLTQRAQSILAAVADGEIAQQRGDQWNIGLTALGNLASYTTLDFTVKADDRKADTAALLRVRLNLSGSNDGLLVLNGAAYGTDSDGAITISDAAAGDINVAVKPAATKLLKPGVYTYDVQLINTDGTVGTLSQGSFEVLADVTRAVS